MFTRGRAAITRNGSPFHYPLIIPKEGTGSYVAGSRTQKDLLARQGGTAGNRLGQHEFISGRPGPEGRKASHAFGRPRRDMRLILQ